MQTYPLLTIITVSFNCAVTIRNTFNSILAQDFRDFEYIVIDGLSSDGTVEIIREFEPLFLRAGIRFSYVSELDRGIYEAMNKGIERATGQWINFLGGDDFFYKESSLSAVAAFISRLSDCYNVVCSHVYCVENLDFRSVRHATPVLLKWGMFPHNGAFVKADLHREHQFDLSFPVASDWDFFLTLYIRDRFNAVLLPDIVVCFSVSGLSSKEGVQMERDNLQITKKHGLYRQFLTRLRKRYPLLKWLLWRPFFLVPKKRSVEESRYLPYQIPSFVRHKALHR